MYSYKVAAQPCICLRCYNSYMAHFLSDILPQPFAWIPISTGKVNLRIYDDSKSDYGPHHIPAFIYQEYDVSAFEIAKYPLTNAQFSKFVEAKGYDQRQWWTDAGWEARMQGLHIPRWDGKTSESPKVQVTGRPWSEPLFWQESKWNKPDYPVVGISWYEATAYCKWLSNLADELINLPSEQQWQRAAQGDTDRPMAWGYLPQYELYELCNWNAEAQNPTWDPQMDSEGTTPVTKYEGKGDSPFGVVDMMGNVWEWCLTNYETRKNDPSGTESRVVRGGGWPLMYSYVRNLGTEDRMGLWPYNRLDYAGFRLMRRQLGSDNM
jgi:formylglycine-generating enzyme required for sulfatase activity